MGEAARYMVLHIDQFLFFLIVASAASSKLFFWRLYNFAEFLSMAFYMMGMYIFIGTLVMILNSILDIRYNQLQLFILLGYMTHVLAPVLGREPWYRWIKYLISAFVAILLYLNLSMIVAYFIIR